MERGMRFCPNWRRATSFPLLIFCFFIPLAKTEITCRSCQPLDKTSSRELLLKLDTLEFATGSGGEVIKYGEGAAGFNSASAESRQTDCTAHSSECGAGQGKYSNSRRKRNIDKHHLQRKSVREAVSNQGRESGRNQNKVTQHQFNGLKVAGVYRAHTITTPASPDKLYKRRFTRITQVKETSEIREKSPASGFIKETLGSIQRHGSAGQAVRRFRRSDSRWREDDRRMANSKPDELKLTSSTFALTGDSAHNQAMVHWSGHNSSVILMLTKFYDFNLGSVTESSLWRSTDYGTTYQKLNEKVGAKTILSYLYVSPNNKRKIMLLTDPEVENSLLISTDEGATYQKYRLSFCVLSLLFHPQQEDWILAYSHDQKLYSSMEFGRRWQLLHERVAPNRFYWSKMGVDKEAGLIHLETSVSDTQTGPAPATTLDASDPSAVPLGRVKACVVIMLQHIIEYQLQKNCYGCQTGHPSQRRHSCLYEAEPYYFQDHFEEITHSITDPTLIQTIYTLLGHYGFNPHPQKIWDIVNGYMHELRSEPYICGYLENFSQNCIDTGDRNIIFDALTTWCADHPWEPAGVAFGDQSM